MSKSAFNELLQASPAIFKSMTKNIPNSEKREVLKIPVRVSRVMTETITKSSISVNPFFRRMLSPLSWTFPYKTRLLEQLGRSAQPYAHTSATYTYTDPPQTPPPRLIRRSTRCFVAQKNKKTLIL